MDELPDASVLEAASWRLASELVRRHADRLRLTRTSPAGGTYNCLSITSRSDGPGRIELNRVGSIHVLDRFDRAPDAVEPSTDLWNPTWADYLANDAAAFLARLETASGLPSPHRAPPTTITTLTYRILAQLAVLHFKSIRSVDIEQGYIDTSGYGGGPNEALSRFAAIDPQLFRQRPGDLFGEPGYRFWIVVRSGEPWLAFEEEQGLAWGTNRPDVVSTMALYDQVGRDVGFTTMELLRRLTSR